MRRIAIVAMVNWKQYFRTSPWYTHGLRAILSVSVTALLFSIILGPGRSLWEAIIDWIPLSVFISAVNLPPQWAFGLRYQQTWPLLLASSGISSAFFAISSVWFGSTVTTSWLILIFIHIFVLRSITFLAFKVVIGTILGLSVGAILMPMTIKRGGELLFSGTITMLLITGWAWSPKQWHIVDPISILMASRIATVNASVSIGWLVFLFLLAWISLRSLD
ncbi:hypothetical protein [Sulfobacillus thermosulfidooxidans]|uniref:hypothetical protein n=1 Tax=Sulfobacillus thermosulfidooxidans TaxID=28034 RepID=UPI00037776F5|nr:hypothetical protein [Sulfobacillus thermosulfidooxidans]